MSFIFVSKFLILLMFVEIGFSVEAKALWQFTFECLGGGGGVKLLVQSTVSTVIFFPYTTSTETMQGSLSECFPANKLVEAYRCVCCCLFFSNWEIAAYTECSAKQEI